MFFLEPQRHFGEKCSPLYCCHCYSLLSSSCALAFFVLTAFPCIMSWLDAVITCYILSCLVALHSLLACAKVNLVLLSSDLYVLPLCWWLIDLVCWVPFWLLLGIDYFPWTCSAPLYSSTHQNEFYLPHVEKWPSGPPSFQCFAILSVIPQWLCPMSSHIFVTFFLLWGMITFPTYMHKINLSATDVPWILPDIHCYQCLAFGRNIKGSLMMK